MHWCIVIHYYYFWRVAVNSLSLDQLGSGSYCLGSKVTLELMCVVEFGSCSNLCSVVVVLHFFLSLSLFLRERSLDPKRSIASLCLLLHTLVALSLSFVPAPSLSLSPTLASIVCVTHFTFANSSPKKNFLSLLLSYSFGALPCKHIKGGQTATEQHQSPSVLQRSWPGLQSLNVYTFCPLITLCSIYLDT